MFAFTWRIKTFIARLIVKFIFTGIDWGLDVKPNKFLISVYDDMSYKDYYLSTIIQNALKVYNVSLIYENVFRYKTIVDHQNNFSFILKYHFPVDSYPLVKYINDYCKNLNICIDVGANHGIVSLFLEKQGAKVYAFEPDKENVIRFQENIKINSSRNISIIEEGVYNFNGKKDFYIHETSGHHSLEELSYENVVNKREIRVTTIDEFCKKENLCKIDLLKIDAEGSELKVLKGCEKMLDNKSIKMIIFEISVPCLKDMGDYRMDICDFLKQKGYKLKNLANKTIDEDYVNNIKGHEDLVACI